MNWFEASYYHVTRQARQANKRIGFLDENVLDMEKRVIEKQEEKKQEPSPYSAEDPIVRINVTEYEDFEEFMMETNESPALQNVSQYNWVTVGDRICALHVITLGTLVLRRDDDGTTRTSMFSFSPPS